MFAKLYPRECCPKLTDIDLPRLWAQGMRALVIDMDNTLLPWHAQTVPPEYVDFLCGARRLGFRVAVLSNNRGARVKNAARQVEAISIPNAGKPYRWGFMRAQKQVGVPAAQCVLVGDQIYTDTLGANHAGFYTILVEPLSEKEFLWTRLMRRLERPIRRRIQQRGGAGRSGDAEAL